MQTNSETAEPVLLLGAYGHGNIGDDIFTVSAAHMFRGRMLYCNAASDALLPAEVHGTMQTISTASLTGWRQKLRLLWRIKTAVYWGGDLWVELYGARRPRQVLYKMLAVNLLLRLFGKRIYYVGSGIGALRGYSLWLARASARLSTAIVVREQRSAALLALPQVQVLPDIAITLPYNRCVLHHAPKQRRLHVVVAALWSIPDKERLFPVLIKHLADLLDSYSPEEIQVTLLPMQREQRDPHDDAWVAEQLAKAIQRHQVHIHQEHTVAAVADLIRGADVVLAVRLHAAILAVLNGTPVLGIAYRPKVRSFFVDSGLAPYCLTLDELDQLNARFHDLRQNYAKVAAQVHAAGTRNLTQRERYAALVAAM